MYVFNSCYIHGYKQNVKKNAGRVKITPGKYSIKKHPRSNYPNDILVNRNDTPIYPTEALMNPCYGQMSQTTLGVALTRMVPTMIALVFRLY